RRHTSFSRDWSSDVCSSDLALSGSGTGANPVIISRIIGGNPMGATQMNTGSDAEELIQAGLMRDLADIADEMDIRSFYVDESLRLEGRRVGKGWTVRWG